MAETLNIPKTPDREEIYAALLPQIAALVGDESDQIANMANVAAILREAFGFFWVGFYRNMNDSLILGPFQGPLACTRIEKGRGVCGAAMLQKKTLRVPNVDEFPGHIACSSASKSEIVVPGVKDGQVQFVLDVDSDVLDDFSEKDESYLNKIVELLL